MTDSPEVTKEWMLDPETEYRFELDPDTTLAITVCLFRIKLKAILNLRMIQLVRGTAEIFGAELGEGITYLFGLECKAAVYTWQGCTLQICLSP